MKGHPKYLRPFCLALLFLFCSSTLFANFIVTTLDQVVVTTEGIYVQCEGNVRQIESLTIANNGYVVAIPRIMAACPKCGCDGYTPGRFCPNCNFPDDGDDFRAHIATNK